jgi:hypothetical protein
VWTPRRVGILLLGVAVLMAAFLGYSLVLGGFDGLPAIPDKYLRQAEGAVVPNYPVPTTILDLQLAFGPDSPEGGSSLEYQNRLQIPGRDGVIACGSPQTDKTPLVTVAPVSVALFGKRAAPLRPGEVRDVSTFHADRAVIRFDRPINKAEDMFSAKVVGLELTSDPDDDANVPTDRKDKRKGRIWISTNRKSPDPADHVVVRTPGPVFVQLPDETTPHDPNVPQIWTTAAVEVFDRQNLPRKLRSRPDADTRLSAVREITDGIRPVAALARPDDLRKFDAVADILAGDALPPPTVVATGLKVFLTPASKPDAAGRRTDRARSFSGVRKVVLGEQVQMNLWADGTGGFPGGANDPPEKEKEKKAVAPRSPNADPPVGLLAVAGGLLDGGTLASRVESRSLLLIETPGAFEYDLENGLATFAVAGEAPPPGRQNFVVVTRLSARNQIDDLVCSKLVLEMDTGKTPDGKPAPPADQKDATGFAVRVATAHGPQVYLSAQAEELEASGAEIKYVREPKANRTVMTLTGTPAAPVIAKRGGSKLTAGDPVTNATVEIVTTDVTENGKPKRVSVASVLGPGRMELVDKADDGGKRSGVARWGKWLKHEIQTQNGKSLDLLKFEENAAFVDPQNGFSLKANSLWLWVARGEQPDRKPDGPPATVGATPERLVAEGDVHVDSDELVVRRTHKLTVWFRDTAPPKVAAAPAPPPKPADAPLPDVPPLPQAEQPKVAQAPKPAEKKPIPNPIQLQADAVETWMVRYPDPTQPPPAKKGDPPAVKYDLERARCDDNVWVKQDPDPNDPDRPAKGLDIKCTKLTLDHQPPAGSVLTVTGGRNKDNYAAVEFDGTTILGHAVVIDQPNNVVSVDGRGRLRVLSGSDVAGNDLSTPSDLQVDWATRMKFEGARAFAQFVGGVVVDQVAKPDPAGQPAGPRPPGETLPAPRAAGPVNPTTNRSNLWCHQLDLTLDRPVYFNQLKGMERNKPQTTATTAKATDKDKAEANDRPKLKLVVVLPNDDPKAPPTDKFVVFRELAEEKGGTLARGRMLTAKQMDFANRAKEQELFATGPGELRILQPESESPAVGPSADPNVRVSARPADKGEMKLTVVSFRDRMTGVDQGGGAFQKADFPNGAVVMNTPSADLMQALEPHALPKGSVYLTCQDRMTVSSRRTKPDAPAEQWLDAVGNAEFRDDNRTGLGEKVRFDGTRAVLDGTDKRLATLLSNKRGVTADQSTRAKQFVYNTKTGEVRVTETSGGAFNSTGR